MLFVVTSSSSSLAVSDLNNNSSSNHHLQPRSRQETLNHTQKRAVIPLPIRLMRPLHESQATTTDSHTSTSMRQAAVVVDPCRPSSRSLGICSARSFLVNSFLVSSSLNSIQGSSSSSKRSSSRPSSRVGRREKMSIRLNKSL